MTKIAEKDFKTRCFCESCELIEEHNLVEGKGVESSFGKLDFLGLRCKNCLNIVVSQPVPFPTSKNWALVLAEEIQEKLDEDS